MPRVFAAAVSELALPIASSRSILPGPIAIVLPLLIRIRKRISGRDVLGDLS
jgi:hypothetical protein